MSKPVCTITNHQFCWNMKVDNYDNTIGDPEYFARHYFALGYRIRIIDARNDAQSKPQHRIKSEDFDPIKYDFMSVFRGEDIVEDYVEPEYLKEPDPEPMTPSDIYKVKKEKVAVMTYHRWRNLKPRDSNHQLCSVCGCHRDNVRVKIGSKTMRWVYSNANGEPFDEIPKCLPKS